MGRLRSKFKRQVKTQVARKLAADKKGIKKKLKRTASRKKGTGSKFMKYGLLQKAIKRKRKSYKHKLRKYKVHLTRADISPISPTLSIKADNLKDCPKMKHMCKRSHKVRKQCPHSCKFLKVKAKK